jgi:hypothetical protein
LSTTPGWPISTCGSFWNARHRDRADALLPALHGLHVVAHDAVDLAGGHQLHDVDLRPAHADGDVQPFLLVQPGGQRLVETAVLGLGVPVGEVAELLLRLHAADGAQQGGGQQQATQRE